MHDPHARVHTVHTNRSYFKVLLRSLRSLRSNYRVFARLEPPKIYIRKDFDKFRLMILKSYAGSLFSSTLWPQFVCLSLACAIKGSV